MLAVYEVLKGNKPKMKNHLPVSKIQVPRLSLQMQTNSKILNYQRESEVDHQRKEHLMWHCYLQRRLEQMRMQTYLF